MPDHSDLRIEISAQTPPTACADAEVADLPSPDRVGKVGRAGAARELRGELGVVVEE